MYSSRLMDWFLTGKIWSVIVHIAEGADINILPCYHFVYLRWKCVDGWLMIICSSNNSKVKSCLVFFAMVFAFRFAKAIFILPRWCSVQVFFLIRVFIMVFWVTVFSLLLFIFGSKLDELSLYPSLDNSCLCPFLLSFNHVNKTINLIALPCFFSFSYSAITAKSLEIFVWAENC